MMKVRGWMSNRLDFQTFEVSLYTVAKDKRRSHTIEQTTRMTLTVHSLRRCAHVVCSFFPLDTAHAQRGRSCRKHLDEQNFNIDADKSMITACGLQGRSL